LCAACAPALACGCAGKDVEAWTPTQHVLWERVTDEPVPRVFNNFAILLPEATRGLFPTSIAVTRVAVEPSSAHNGALRAQLVREPRNEFLMWNSTFDHQMAVSEVFPIEERDLGGGEVVPAQIIAANRALGAGLAMIYAVNEMSPVECEMIGGLHDTASGNLLAVFHARAESPVEEPEEDSAGNPYETDATALARERFERVVRSCVYEIILQDEPAAVESPRGWTPAGTLAPAEWPPRRFRTGR